MTSYKIKADEPIEAPALDIPANVLAVFATEMWKQIGETGNHVRALQFLDSLPPLIVAEPKIVAARGVTTAKLEQLQLPPTRLVETVLSNPTIFDGGDRRSLDIVIWTGPAWEQWSPKNLETTGIGGSETAAVHMGRELVARGHKVTQLGDHRGLEGVYDGVKYVHFQRILERPQDYPCDILVCSRQPELFKFPLEFKASFLWVHDIHVGPAVEELHQNLFPKIDRIFCLSNWHKDFFKSCYPYLEDDKIIVTKNGLDLRRFMKTPNKIGDRLIYSSSPDRGLERLIELLPQIKNKVPTAEVHVYYGFENWKKMATTAGATADLEKISRFEQSIAKAEAHGLLKYHGRVNQQELADAFLASKVWTFPTWFTETYCLSAIEAQAGGCVPVSTHLAALPETVSHGFLIKPPNTLPEYGATFVKRVVSLLQDENLRSDYARAGREYTFVNHSWSLVAESWEKHFYDLLRSKTSPTPKPLTSIAPQAPTPSHVSLLEPKKMRIAVILGKMGKAIHGVMDVENIYESTETFVTGTVSGFYNIVWGLAERGHHIDAFCDAKHNVIGSSKYNGANFYTLETGADNIYDAYISVNEPDMLRTCPAQKLRICVQWLNDFSYCQSMWDSHVDIYGVPSKRLIDHLANNFYVSRSKMIKIPLSINPEFYQSSIIRKPGSIAYASSPDRGLHVLLEIFPEIRRRVPHATLNIYYLIQPWLEHFLSGTENGTRQHQIALLVSETFERLGTNGENGVTVVGPVPTRVMARELQATEILAYTYDPIAFTEGFSVTVLDACAAGCVPIIAGVDALTEVHGSGVHLIPGPASQHKEEWIETICRALTDEQFRTSITTRGRAHAATMTRQKVAAQWEKLIMDNLKPCT